MQCGGEAADEHILDPMTVQGPQYLLWLEPRHAAPLRDSASAPSALFEIEHVEQVLEALLRRPLKSFDDLIDVDALGVSATGAK